MRQPPIDTDEWWQRARELAVAAGAGSVGTIGGGPPPDTSAATKRRHQRGASELAGLVRPWVYRLAASQFPYHGDADDIAQNVSIVVLSSVVKLRDPSRLRSWLVAVTLNEVRGFYRRRTREGDILRQAHSGRPPNHVAAERTSILGGHRVDLLDGLNHLPRHQAFALGLRQLGLSYGEIATEMSLPERLSDLFDDRSGPIPVGSVKRWVSNARDRLRTMVGETAC